MRRQHIWTMDYERWCFMAATNPKIGDPPHTPWPLHSKYPASIAQLEQPSPDKVLLSSQASLPSSKPSPQIGLHWESTVQSHPGSTWNHSMSTSKEDNQNSICCYSVMSTLHDLEQPSPDIFPPSSQSSDWWFTRPSPQFAALNPAVNSVRWEQLQVTEVVLASIVVHLVEKQQKRVNNIKAKKK